MNFRNKFLRVMRNICESGDALVHMKQGDRGRGSRSVRNGTVPHDSTRTNRASLAGTVYGLSAIRAQSCGAHY